MMDETEALAPNSPAAAEMAGTMAPQKPLPPLRILEPEAPPLTPEQREQYLLLLVQGASLTFACRKLDVSLLAVMQAMEANEGFREEVERAGEALSSSVAAALYKSAVSGSVTAQMFYLRSRPPSAWLTPLGEGSDDLDELTDAELFTKCLAEGVPVPAEAQKMPGPAAGAAQS